jgi:hypothetical protein
MTPTLLGDVPPKMLPIKQLVAHVRPSSADGNDAIGNGDGSATEKPTAIVGIVVLKGRRAQGREVLRLIQICLA